MVRPKVLHCSVGTAFIPATQYLSVFPTIETVVKDSLYLLYEIRFPITPQLGWQDYPTFTRFVRRLFKSFINIVAWLQVKWRPVIWGLALQIIFAFIILQTDAGFKVFDFLGDVVYTFLNYSDEGSKFVFGDPMYLDHRFAFQV